nr:MAG TPA: CC FOXP coiled-coil domain protein [Caudoviricetes sp.]
MIQVIPVKRAYVSMSCDWPGCEERIDFPEGPNDAVRNATLLNASYALARRLGWL